MRSNVRLRSNVQVSASGVPSDVATIRGRRAILRWLQEGSGDDTTEASRRAILTQRQLTDLLWELPCGVCGALPEGPVVVGGAVEVQFRCPRGTCGAQELTTRTVLFDLGLLKLALQQFKGDASQLVARAMVRDGRSGADLPEVPLAPQAQLRPIPVRMPPTVAYKLRALPDGRLAAVVNAAVRQLLGIHG